MGNVTKPPANYLWGYDSLRTSMSSQDGMAAGDAADDVMVDIS